MVEMFDGVFGGRRILITGHTGFKGSWLALWLHSLGAKVTGLAFPAHTEPNHWALLDLPIESLYVDIRDETGLRKAVNRVQPEIVFHLAAQPLVRRSYRQPLETWSTNVMGTAYVLDACRQIHDLRAILVVTTDKCYENRDWVWGYRESDSLGGHDPYSASKGGSELVAASYRRSFFYSDSAPLLATARAGNVIGGGDWSEDRLIPDLIRSRVFNHELEIRSPFATRPWQHVLECLSGYLMLAARLFNHEKAFAEAWNFGPERDGNRQVVEVLEAMERDWSGFSWNVGTSPQPHEAQLLHLDSGKAQNTLCWRPVWTFEETVAATTAWYRTWAERSSVISKDQLLAYAALARKRGLRWAAGKV